MRKRIMLLGAAAAMAAGGCATLGQRTFTEPEVTLHDVRVRGLGVSGGSVDVVLKVYNPNRFGLDATRLSYNLYADSILVGQGTTDGRFVVPARDTALVPLPVDFRWSGLGAAGRQLFETGAVNYRVAGDVTVGTPIGGYTVPFSGRGRFSTFGGSSSR